MSREYEGKYIVIYPPYIDSKKSRKDGRKIPLKHAVPNPSIDEILRACTSLLLDPKIEHKTYPRDPNVKTRIVIIKRYNKVKTLIMIAGKINEMRRETRHVTAQ